LKILDEDLKGFVGEGHTRRKHINSKDRWKALAYASIYVIV
jgi:hypothetical protein